MSYPIPTQCEIDDAAQWHAATFARPNVVPATFTANRVHPLATIGAIVDTAQRENVDADRLAGTMLGEVGDDPAAAHYYALVLIDRCSADRAARRIHTFWHGDVTRGDTDKHADAPDPYTRVQSSSVQRRSNSGVSYRQVTVHGRSYVGGDRMADHSPGLSMSPARLAHALDTAPRTATGHVDGIALNRLVDVAYPDLPRLSGADTVQWADFAAYDEIAAATPRRGWKPRMALTGSRTPDPSFVQYSHELTAPRDEHTVWVGHHVAPRKVTVREHRATRVRRVDESLTCDLEHLAETLDIVQPGKRYTWTAGDYHGAVTTGTPDRPRYSITGLPAAIRGCRTLAALQRNVAQTVATV